MSSHTDTIDVFTLRLPDSEPVRAHRRFAAIVRALAGLTMKRPAAPPAVAPAAAELAGPMRRPNRIRRLLGRIPRPGKSRQHARRPL
jgi:hypothetical protein